MALLKFRVQEAHEFIRSVCEVPDIGRPAVRERCLSIRTGIRTGAGSALACEVVGELETGEAWRRSKVSELLLELGDPRGIPARIDALEAGAALYSAPVLRADDASRGIRMFACRDLRVYSQQPLPCAPTARGESLAGQVAAWRAWWKATGPGIPLKVREARLDIEAMYTVRPMTIGEHVAR